MNRGFQNWVSALESISLLLVIIWIVGLSNAFFQHAFSHFGIYPRELTSLPGIFLWVLLHGDLTHLVMNTAPLFFLGFFVALRGVWLFVKITATVWLLAGLAVWIFGRPAIHLGASGLIFGYFGFLMAIAIYEKRVSDLAVATVVVFTYGGLIFGIFPVEAYISWESHLFGLLAGILAARWYRRSWLKASGGTG